MSHPKHILHAASLSIVAAAGLCLSPSAASAQDSYYGELRAFAFNYCPRGWLPAQGDTVTIAEFSALYALLGVRFGGDGVTDFALPDLRGRAPIAAGQGPGLNYYILGEYGGTEVFRLSVAQLPEHSHIVEATNAEADQIGPGGDFLAYGQSSDGNEVYMYHDGPPNKTMDPGMIRPTGDNNLIQKRSPFLALT